MCDQNEDTKFQERTDVLYISRINSWHEWSIHIYINATVCAGVRSGAGNCEKCLVCYSSTGGIMATMLCCKEMAVAWLDHKYGNDNVIIRIGISGRTNK